MPTNLTPEQALVRLEEMISEDDLAEAERIADLTAAELDAEIASEGLDPEAVRAFAREEVGKLRETAPPAAAPSVAPAPPVAPAPSVAPAPPVAPAAPLAPAPPPHARVVEWLGGLGIAASFVLGMLSASGFFTVAAEVGNGNPNAEAEELRAQATRLAADRRFEESLEALDRARAIDPAGDGAKEVRELRVLDEEGLRGKPPAEKK